MKRLVIFSTLLAMCALGLACTPNRMKRVLIIGSEEFCETMLLLLKGRAEVWPTMDYKRFTRRANIRNFSSVFIDDSTAVERNVNVNEMDAIIRRVYNNPNVYTFGVGEIPATETLIRMI